MTREAVFLVLGTVSIGCIVIAFRLTPSEAGVPHGKMPNIVFVLSDNQNRKLMGCAGHPFLETPNMDRLAGEGILFTNALVTTSLCRPSRASFLTGRYAHTHGVQNNFAPWDGSHRTFLEVLEEAGYDTAFIGKRHMPGSLPKLEGVGPFITFTIQGDVCIGSAFTESDCLLYVDPETCGRGCSGERKNTAEREAGALRAQGCTKQPSLE